MADVGIIADTVTDEENKEKEKNMCKKIFSMEARNERLAKKLARKEARAEHKKLKRELVEADLYIRDADSELYNMKRDFKVDKKIRNIDRKTKKAKSQSAYEKMRNELDKSKHARTARKLERQRYKKETREMRLVRGASSYKSKYNRTLSPRSRYKGYSYNRKYK